METQLSEDLFNGIAVIIDDEINKKDANIQKIIQQIESRQIPVLKYHNIPEKEEVVDHFQNLSFLLLDWNLGNTHTTPAITIPDTLQDYDAQKNIAFIRRLNEKCFCPIFIFTNEDPDNIKNALIEKELMTDGKPSNLFVLAKSRLADPDSLFKEVNGWLHENPSMYVLKKWEATYQISKTRLFSDFYTISSEWPAIMWQTFSADGVDPASETGELISNNLHARMAPFEFDGGILNKTQETPPKTELRRLLEGARFLKKDRLHDKNIGTGDLFKQKDQDEKDIYYLNIRAQCDLLRSKKIGKVDLYCLKGRVIDEQEINQPDGISFHEGQFAEKINDAIIPFLDNEKIIKFSFRDIRVIKWKELEKKRIGRLLPPYINRIQQRYAAYMQRQGLPRTPDAAI